MVDRFPVVLRGYDKEKVDAAFDATQESMKRAQQTLASMREQIAADDDRILQLQAQLQEEKNKKPEGNSFASLGANAQQMLASAEQTSTELLERAKQDASSIRTTAQAQAETLINNAKLDAQHIVDDANAKAASILTNASNQAESVTTSANEDAAQLRSETAKTITEQRQTVELELSNAREEHTKKMASERSTQEREIADMKAEATQQVAAMRKSANEEITKLKSDSNDQIEAALAEANKKLADVREQVSKMMTEAQRKASEIIDAAKTKGQEITDEAEVKRTSTMSQVNAEVEQIRHDIAAQQDEATKKVNELLQHLEEWRPSGKPMSWSVRPRTLATKPIRMPRPSARRRTSRPPQSYIRRARKPMRRSRSVAPPPKASLTVCPSASPICRNASPSSPSVFRNCVLCSRRRSPDSLSAVMRRPLVRIRKPLPRRHCRWLRPSRKSSLYTTRPMTSRVS